MRCQFNSKYLRRLPGLAWILRGHWLFLALMLSWKVIKFFLYFFSMMLYKHYKPTIPVFEEFFLGRQVRFPSEPMAFGVQRRIAFGRRLWTVTHPRILWDFQPKNPGN